MDTGAVAAKKASVPIGQGPPGIRSKEIGRATAH